MYLMSDNLSILEKKNYFTTMYTRCLYIVYRIIIEHNVHYRFLLFKMYSLYMYFIHCIYFLFAASTVCVSFHKQ